MIRDEGDNVVRITCLGMWKGENDKNLRENNTKRGFIKEVLMYVMQYNSPFSAFSEDLLEKTCFSFLFSFSRIVSFGRDTVRGCFLGRAILSSLCIPREYLHCFENLSET